jgi:hypothetical protein
MNAGAGRKGRRWGRLREEVRARRANCCRCHQPIDYDLAFPHPWSFSVDHWPHPLSTHPWLAEDPANLRAAHLKCNQNAGDDGVQPGLGPPSEAW